MTSVLWTPAYIGIGSNLDDPKAQVIRGFDALASLPESQLITRSKLYRTAPLGSEPQPDYVNAVAGLLTKLDAARLLSELKALEKKQGRTLPIVRWGPRVIDFDLLALGSQRVDSDELKVPHPGISERAFVLVPLAEIAPDLDIPGVGKPRVLATRVDTSAVRPL